ncbi:MAG TPA: MlaD family protein [Candidatus Deferrimicrobiaceae bacterium]|jgi:phospholipid/cholesterol/gamma-HCH transport system substrate-binding protein|nr:MlaD family protein [Candidatus Deferrimicrobiaceae bacterium]
MSKEAKVGIFVLLGIMVLTYFTFRISKLGGIAGKGYNLTVDFETAAGLEPKSNVKMAGVPIGKVEGIQLVGNNARLVLRIDPGVQIPVDSVASIQTQGLLGEKYVEILPGKDTSRMLPPKGKIANTLPPANLDEIIRKVSEISEDLRSFTQTLSQTLGTEEGRKAVSDIIRNVQRTTEVLNTVVAGNEERLNRILANVDTLSADLTDFSSTNKEDLRATIANLRAFSNTLKTEGPGLAKKLEEMSERVSGVVGENRENFRESIENLKNASAKLDNTLDSAGKVLAKIERGEGTLGKLVSDNTTVTTLNDTLEGINRYVRKTESLKAFLDYHLEYQTEPSEFKHYANLRLQPTADKYYLIGIVDDPRGKFDSSETTTTTTPGGTVRTQQESYSNDLKFTAIVAKRFSALTIRGGVLESTGGVGLDYHLMKDRLSIGVDAFDFARKDQPPRLKVFGNYDIVKNLYITGGVDDVLNDEKNLRTLFFGFGIKFEDEDLKTVLGAVPIRP